MVAVRSLWLAYFIYHDEEGMGLIVIILASRPIVEVLHQFL
jgi:hypothetical protein